MINPKKLFLLLTLAAGSIGCGLPAAWHAKADKLPQATPEDPAVEMICIWEPAEGIGPDGLPTRGFAGNVSFFTRRQETSVRVKGDVRVYVYDDQGPIEKRAQPIHHWDFIGDAWAFHLHDSAIGPGYSLFIPYSRKVSHQVQCAVRVRFTPENGTPIFSNTAAVILPGPLKKKESEPKTNSRKEQRTSLESITIPLKERRRAELENMSLGGTERTRTVAPVSELNRRSAAEPGRFSGSHATMRSVDAVPQSISAIPQDVQQAVYPPPPATTQAAETVPPAHPFRQPASPQRYQPASRSQEGFTGRDF
jgi:hypothetical protein